MFITWPGVHTHCASFRALDCLGWFSKVSTRLLQKPCLSESYCGWTPPLHRLLRSDWAGRGAGGRSRLKRWCTAAGSSAGSANRCCLLRPSWRTGTTQQQWNSTGDKVRMWTEKARSEPGGGCSLGKVEADRCGTSLPGWSPWRLPSWCQGRHWKQGCAKGCKWRRTPSEGSGPGGQRSGNQAGRGGMWTAVLRS